jgi:hypothetical protein
MTNVMLLVAPFWSTTVTVSVAVVGAVGVPVIFPVTGSKVSPVGKVPAVIE